MATDVLSNVAGGILTNLASLAFKELGLLCEFKLEVEKLESIVLAIQSLLLVAEDPHYSGNPQVKDWIGKLKDAMEDADNLLDDLNIEALRQQAMDGSKITKKVRIFFSSKNQVVFGLKMAHKIKSIRERLDFIKDEKNFHLDECPREVRVITRRREETHSFSPPIVVGREEDKNRMVELLLSSNYGEESVSVLSIWGIGGIGKTTLIKLVFNDERVKKEFNLKIWICVSNEFDIKLIMKKMLLEISKDVGDLPLNALINEVQQKINGKKYLVVLDDVWNEDSILWYELKNLLMGGGKGSKIIVTTRSQGIGEMTKTLAIYEIKGLSLEESWDLFKKMAFESGSGPQSSNHERIGKEILAKCKGVPLAIQTLGRTLFHKKTESEWSTFKDKEVMDLKQNTNDIMPTLELSYNHLPSHLKHCFSLCSLYPKDYEIEVRELVNLWIAQGYVPYGENSSLTTEDMGFEYFEELSWRSFFQEMKVDEFGRIRSCKVHDLMHDLAQLMNGKQCALLSSNKRDDITKKTRHVNFVKYKYNTSHNLPLDKNKIRTILFPLRNILTDQRCHEFIANSRHVRALRIRCMNVVPDYISKLKHLRYLSISQSGGLKSLPHWISKLLNLQILDLSYCQHLKTLPKSIKKLINLCQLNLTECYSLTYMPRGIERLTTLRVLSLFVVSQRSDSARLTELHGLNNLRGDLAIINLENVRIPNDECRAARLNAKQHLQSLSLCWRSNKLNKDHTSYSDKDKTCLEELQPHVNLKSLKLDGYRGVNFPQWLSILTNLVDIRIEMCRNCQIIPPLDQISSLKRMWISHMWELEYIEIGDDGVKSSYDDSNNSYNGEGKEGKARRSFYKSLEELEVSNCPMLKGWQRRSSSATVPVNIQDYYIFPCLTKLTFAECPNLMNNWMPSYPSLTHMNLGICKTEAIELMLKLTISTDHHQHSSSCSSTSMVSSPHSHVEKLYINSCYDLEVLPEESLQYFTSLKTLSIADSHNLRSVSQAIRHLTSLRDLTIQNCTNLDDIFDTEGGQALKSLHSLWIREMPKLVSLPEGLQHATNLRELLIWDCTNLKCLPAWMPNLTALQQLSICGCSSEVSERFKNNTAQGWPLISHIPNISIS